MSRSSFVATRHPNSKGIRWQPSEQMIKRRIPQHILPAMLDKQSLTAHMLALCGDREFHVDVITQYRRAAHHHELATLPTGTAGLIERNVHLCCDGRPWVFAHTVIPVSSLQGPQRRLARMGSQPLGAALFADPLMRRDIIEYGTMDARCELFAQAIQPLEHRPTEIWGRRSRFLLNKQPLLVAEFFLPNWGHQ